MNNLYRLSMKPTISFIFILTLLFFSSLNLSADEEWKLVWSDEFEYEGLPDETKWSYDIRGNSYGWGNNEAQWYAEFRPENTYVSKGTLKITAIKEYMCGKNYSSGRLITKHKGDWKYCKIEVRAKLPSGRGTWPAIWMLSTNNSYGSWPDSGEIDIMEQVGFNPQNIFSTTHTNKYNHIKKTQKKGEYYCPDATSEFHVYGLEWEEDQYRAYIDGIHYYTYENDHTGWESWPFDKTFYLILNLAIGGGLGGKEGIDDSLFPHIFEIDYVRVYQKEKDIPLPDDSLSGTDKTSYEASGVVSILCENFEEAENWKEKTYYTGKGISSGSSEDGTCYTDYSVCVTSGGEYKLYILGNKKPYSETSDNVISIQLSEDGINFKEQERIIFNDLNVPSWTCRSLLKEDGIASINFSGPGIYIIRAVPIKGEKIFLEKILLSNNDYIPTGMGPLPTLIGKGLKKGFDPMVILPPKWAFGVLYGGYTDQKETLEIVDRLIEEDYPIDAYWIDSWFWNFKNHGAGPDGYMSFVEDKSAFPDVEEMWTEFEKRNVKGGIWIWNCILRDGNEKVYEDFLDRGFFSGVYREKGKWHNKKGDTECGNIDFENPEAVIYWKSLMKPLFDKGLDFLKLDRSSAIPYCKAAFEASQELGKETEGRGFILAHLHTAYDSRHKLYPTKYMLDPA